VDECRPLHDGGDRNKSSGAHLDILLTSYEVAMNDSASLDKIKWGGIIVDEGHRLKNWQSRLSKTLSNMHSPFRCLLTGTPLQNNLEELFALLHFLAGGLLMTHTRPTLYRLTTSARLTA
jgi:SNF2 family DNA or RNA helicase